ncbi:MAG: cysteine synthase family protein, partial [Bacteroidota bacterium]
MKKSILTSIGNTPLVKLQNLASPGAAEVYVKLEYFNPSGSYKDRMALAMLEEAEARGELKPGMTVVECTGGNTGSALALLCAVKGYRFHVISSNAYAPEKLNTMRAFGAHLEMVTSPSGKITPDLLPRMMARARELGKREGYFYTDQFNNHDELKGYIHLGQEIRQELGASPDVFCGAVGTAGMLMGVAEDLLKASPSTQIVAFEPKTSAVLSGEAAGSHRIEGIGVGFVPPLLNRDYLDEVRTIPESEAREMVRQLAQEEGIFAGTSTGVNVWGALQIARELGKGKKVVTVACDAGL